MEVEGVIFDLDGTLIDYEGVSHTALEIPLARRLGPDWQLPWSLHAQIIGTKPDYWGRFLPEATGLHGQLPPEQYAQEYFAEAELLYAQILAWPGTAQLLDRLGRAGFPMAIATSSPRSSFEKKMTHHPGLLAKMSAVVTGDEVANGKPAPDIFLEAAARIGCDPARCVVFEDSPHGVRGAHAAGCLAVALPDGRMPAVLGQFEELRPKWTLPDGIGSFDPGWIHRVPRTGRGS